MKKLLAIIVGLLLITTPVQAALTFAITSDRISIGTNAVLDNMDPWTIIVWTKLDNLGDGQTFYQKGLGPTGRQNFSLTDPTGGVGLRVSSRRATVDTLADVQVANVPALAAGKWVFLAGVADLTTSTNNKIFGGDLMTIVQEAATYRLQTNGLGTQANNSGQTAFVGNNANLNASPKGSYAFIGIWNRGLSLEEIRAQQFFPHVTSGNVLFMFPGFGSASGLGTQPDWSGKGNAGTVTGALMSTTTGVEFTHIF